MLIITHPIMLLLVDILAWGCLHLGISWGIRQVPLAFFRGTCGMVSFILF